MPRYIDVDALIESIQDTICNKCDMYDGVKCKSCGIDDTLDFLETAPSADVVPKSEVENILDGLMKEAREIADRYEKSANETSDYDYARIEYRGCQMGALLVLFKIAELKKKYLGEN
jgi:hypothetical protein